MTELISNVRVYGVEESLVASGYPMRSTPPTEDEFEEELRNIENHTNRSIKLGKTNMGEGHDNYLNGCNVHFDLNFTIKAWTEAERYHFFDFVSSCSTMHKLKDMDLEDCYIKYVDERIIDVMKQLQNKYNDTKDKEDLLNLIYSNPVGMKLTARMTTNYRQLKTIYNQRKTHRLPEWKEFCAWCLKLPYFKEFVEK